MTPEDFVQTYSGLADDISARTNLDPNIVLGLVAHETGWGNHALGSNIFGVMRPGTQQVQPYKDVNEASTAFVDLINRRYAPATQQTTPAGQAAALVQGGYNSDDPGYAHHLSLYAAHAAQIKAKLGGGGTSPAPAGGTGDGTGDPVAQPTQTAGLTPQQQIQQDAEQNKQGGGNTSGGTAGVVANPPVKTDTTPPPPASRYPKGSAGEAIEKANQGLPGFLQGPTPDDVPTTSPFTPYRRNAQTGEGHWVVPDIIRAPIAGAGKVLMGEPPAVWGQDPDIGGLFTTLAGGSRSPGYRPMPKNPLVTSAETPPVAPVEGGGAGVPPVPPAAPTSTGASPFQPKGADVTGFQTEKGSTYVINPGGTTTRNKAPRPEHPGDFGPKPPSDVTFYVKPEDVQKFATPDDTSWRIVPTNEDNTAFSVVTKRSDGTWGVSPSQNNIPVETQPGLGLHPMELSSRDDINVANGSFPAFREMHPGNKIVQLSRDPNPSFEPNKVPGAGEPQATPSAQPAQPYTPPSQQQVDQMIGGIMQRFQEIQRQHGAGFLRSLGAGEMRDVIKNGISGIIKAFVPVPGVGIITDAAINAAASFFGKRSLGRSLSGLEQQLRDSLRDLHGGAGSDAPITPPTPPQPPVRSPFGSATRGMLRQGVVTTPTANQNAKSKLMAPPGTVDMRNRLIYRQR